ncbi:MAG: hypothetical protein ACRD2O_11665 [Terriglobia bacterium]
MPGSQIVEIAFGLIFVYLLFSVICSALNEVVAWIFDLRAKTLRNGIDKLLADPNVQGLATGIYNHPLVRGLYQGGRPPSYISSRSFGLALMDVIVSLPRPVGAASAPDTAQAETTEVQQEKIPIARVRAAVLNLPAGSPVRKILLAVLDETVTDLNQARQSIGVWFDEAMAAVGGTYKRKAQRIVLACAIVVTVGLNVDTIRITSTLWTGGNLRAAMAAQAEAFQRSNQALGPGSVPAVSQSLNRLQQLELPIGWHRGISHSLRSGLWQARRRIIDKLAGWVLTIIAVSLGAPFWFAALNKIVNLRATGTPPEALLREAGQG